MTESILNSTKKVLQITEDYNEFDVDIIMHINSTFAVLTQLGVGPTFGFMIEDASTDWNDFLVDDARLNMVKSYMYTKVRLLFDPPATSFHLSALKEQAQEYEWRLNVQREGVFWIPPSPIVDGGNSLEG